MYINHFRTLPDHVYVGFSGGVDSVALVHSILTRGKKPTIAFLHHGNEFADVEEKFVRNFAKSHDLPLVIAQGQSWSQGSREQHWRRQRRQFFTSLPGMVAVGQHLNDAAEWYLFTALRGNPVFYQYQTDNIVKPLLLYDKIFITEYAVRHGLEWLDDPSNDQEDFACRNRIRHNILPECLKVNPGFLTTIKNLLIEHNNSTE